MRKLGWIAVVIGVLAFTRLASAETIIDHFEISEQNGNTIVQVKGLKDSSASEIYGILDKARVTGTLISANDVGTVEGDTFDATFTIASGSSYGLLPYHCAPANACPGRSSTLVISGDVAHELYNDMVKANLPMTHAVDGTSVVGTNVSCREAVIELSPGMDDPVEYRCSIALRVQP